MARLSLHNLGKHYGRGKQVLHDINLEIAAGELLVLVGPSGCGKSTLLRMIAGLEDISSGELHIDGKLANHIAPAQRGLAMVFQSYALYPHMTVFENMGFALKMARKSSAEISAAVLHAAQILQISALLQRKPGQLSGGQRQRVAIGRAIVRQPQVFLFDEPLSNLDASLRLQMRLEISRLHQQLGSTMVYVTHDQVEAMTLGQRIVVMQAGQIEQVGTPRQLYETPRNLFVAGFLGTPKMNFLPAHFIARQGAHWQLACGEATLEIAADSMLEHAQGLNQAANTAHLTLGIRPEQLELYAQASHAHNMLAVRVAHIEYLGDAAQVYLQAASCEQLICARQPVSAGQTHYRPGQQLWLRLPPAHCHLFGSDGLALRHASHAHHAAAAGLPLPQSGGSAAIAQ